MEESQNWTGGNQDWRNVCPINLIKIVYERSSTGRRDIYYCSKALVKRILRNTGPLRWLQSQRTLSGRESSAKE